MLFSLLLSTHQALGGDPNKDVERADQGPELVFRALQPLERACVPLRVAVSVVAHISQDAHLQSRMDLGVALARRRREVEPRDGNALVVRELELKEAADIFVGDNVVAVGGCRDAAVAGVCADVHNLRDTDVHILDNSGDLCSNLWNLDVDYLRDVDILDTALLGNGNGNALAR